VTERVELDFDGGVTPIDIGAGAIGELAPQLADWARGRKLFILSSQSIRSLHGGRLSGVEESAAEVHHLDVPDGERAKTTDEVARIWRRMLELGGKRDSRLLALGGGTVTDLGGFAAGCFLRGIEFVSLPTTLLGQVDAAIGGKTGVNLPEGKNTVGLFHHPGHVICDTEVLSTLPAPEIRAGLMEVVKMAFLLDPPLLDQVETSTEQLLAGDGEASAPIVAAAVRAKVGVVERDPEEADERRLLNFGHTLGHAIEAVLDYGTLRHGEAVGFGMLFALRLSVARGLASESAARLRGVIAGLELPELPKLEADPLVRALGRDKKAREGGLAWILAHELGEGRIVTDVTLAEVRGELAGFLADPWSVP